MKFHNNAHALPQDAAPASQYLCFKSLDVDYYPLRRHNAGVVKRGRGDGQRYCAGELLIRNCEPADAVTVITREERRRA